MLTTASRSTMIAFQGFDVDPGCPELAIQERVCGADAARRNRPRVLHELQERRSIGLGRQKLDVIVPLLESIDEKGLLDFIGELCSAFAACGIAEQGQQDEGRRQPLLSVDQQELRHAFGH